MAESPKHTVDTKQSAFLKVTVNGKMFTAATQENSYSNGKELGFLASPDLLYALGQASEVKAQMGSGFGYIFENTNGYKFNQAIRKASQRCKNSQ